MMEFEKKIRRYSTGLSETHFSEEEALLCTVQRSGKAFFDHEAERSLSYTEFLYQQSQYIHKRWWVLQGALLLLLWLLLQINDSAYLTKRLTGILASLFAVLIVPELWKNRSSASTEVECTSFYTLRQIYSARMLLFAMADLLLLSLFFFTMAMTGGFTAKTFFIDFFLPFNVTVCICFRTLCSQRIESEYMAILLCLLWISIWLSVLLKEAVYAAFVLPLSGGMVFLSFLYLAYCVRKTICDCENEITR